MAVLESEASWTQAEVAMLLSDDAVVDGVYGIGIAAGGMTPLCIGIGDDGNRAADTGATMYI